MKTPEEVKNGLEYLSISNVAEKLKLAKRGLPYKYTEEVAADALAYIQQLEAAQPKWISTKTPPTKWKEDGSTKDLINYQIYSPEYGVDVGNWLEPAGVWCIFGMPVKSVTHWMPLPEEPKEG